MALLGKDDILKADDRPVEEVSVPEWGGEVLVRGISGRERDKLEASTVTKEEDEEGNVVRKLDYANFRARLLAASLVDEDGKLLFSEEDVEALGDKSAAAIGRVAEVAVRLSGMSDEDVEELVEDFDGDQSDDSTSD